MQTTLFVAPIDYRVVADLEIYKQATGRSKRHIVEEALRQYLDGKKPAKVSKKRTGR